MTENQEKFEEDGQPEQDIPQVESPICLECAKPVSELDYYCPHCGAASGQLTPTLPYVNIPYQISFYGRLWRRVWDRDTELWMKLAGWFVILTFMPLMIIATPFALLDRRRQAIEAARTRTDFTSGP